MKKLSLRLRLASFGALAIIISLAVVGYGLVLLFGEHVERRALAEMEVQLEQVLAGLRTGPEGLELGTPLTDSRFIRPYGGRYWQVASTSGIIRSRSLWDVSLNEIAGTSVTGDAGVFRQQGPNDEPLLGLWRTVQLPPSLGATRVEVAVAMDEGELIIARRAFTADLAPYLMLLGLILIASQVAQLSYGLKPLRQIGARVAALRTGKARRMGEGWPKEMQPLAGEIDGLLEAQDSAIERARYRAADLAHGLKTPLQALLGEANRLRQRGEITPATAIEDVVRTMQAHVDRELARARTVVQAQHVRSVLAEVVERIVDVVKRTPEGEAVDWRVDIPSNLVVAIDFADLAEALGALVENAMRHATSMVQITSTQDNGRIRLHILDDGPGIPKTELESVMQRGTRLDESSSGSGFGLSIASEIAEATGGRLILENFPVGCQATLELPSAEGGAPN